MGPLKSLKRMTSNGVKKVGNFIGERIEKAGQALHSLEIQTAGFKLRCACDFGNTSWNKDASVSRTVDVHVELRKVTESIKPSADETEEKLIGICISEVREVLTPFLELIPCQELNSLNEKLGMDIQDKLSGQVMMFIQPRLSLDDKECKEVLEISDDTQRKQKAEEFTKKVLKKAEQEFTNRCVGVKDEYIDRILKIADGECDSAKKEAKALEEILEKMRAEGKGAQDIDNRRADELIVIEELTALRAVAVGN